MYILCFLSSSLLSVTDPLQRQAPSVDELPEVQQGNGNSAASRTIEARRAPRARRSRNQRNRMPEVYINCSLHPILDPV